MQRIKILRNTGRGLPKLLEGQVVDVEDELAETLLCRNLAIALLPPKIHAVPPLEVIQAVPEVETEENEESTTEGFPTKTRGKKRRERSE